MSSHVSTDIVTRCIQDHAMLDRPNISARGRVIGIVQEILAKRSIRRPVLAEDNLREIGVSSLDMVNLMLSVEAEFDLKIPDGDMTPTNFRSVASIDALISALSAAR